MDETAHKLVNEILETLKKVKRVIAQHEAHLYGETVDDLDHEIFRLETMNKKALTQNLESNTKKSLAQEIKSLEGQKFNRNLN